MGPLFNSFDRAERSLNTLKGIVSATDYNKKNKDFVEYTDTLFSDVVKFSTIIQDNGTIYLLAQYANPDSLIKATNDINTTISLYKFLQKAKDENYNLETFRHRLEVLTGYPKQDADSLYNNIFALKDLFGDNSFYLNRMDLEIKK